MVGLKVTTREGRELTLEVAAGAALMYALRDADIGIAGTCGGAASCGTCHVEIDPAWVARLTPPCEEEADMLEALSEVTQIGPCSRLSCQIVADTALDGLVLTIAAED